MFDLTEPRGTDIDPRTLLALDFMKANLHRSVSMTEVASAVGLSRSRLYSVFTRSVGMAPLQYLKALRAQRSAALLESTFLSIKQVAAEVGYADDSHFMRDFRRAYGLRPSEYRERYFREELGSQTEPTGRSSSK